MSEFTARQFELIPPMQFGVVEDNLYRGGIPVVANFTYLLALKLKVSNTFYIQCEALHILKIISIYFNLMEKMILSLVPECPSLELRQFAKVFNIEFVHIPVPRSCRSVINRCSL